MLNLVVSTSSGGTAQTRTLQRAVEVIGSVERLAQALGVHLTDLRAWIAGLRPLPNDIYLRALDIVAGNSSATRITKPKTL